MDVFLYMRTTQLARQSLNGLEIQAGLKNCGEESWTN